MSRYSWYNEKEKATLDLSAPIINDMGDGEIELLMPVTNGQDYNIIGYNWFNITTGCWNSSATWPTPQEALEMREHARNAIIKII